MKKSHLLTFSCLMLLPVMAFSQTKMIAHKSHSGTASTFKLDSKDNLGLGPSPEEMRRERSIVDSIIQTSDSSIIVFYTDTAAWVNGKLGTVNFNDTVRNSDPFFDENVAFYKTRYPAKFIVLKNPPVKNRDNKKQQTFPVFISPQNPDNNSGLMLPVVFISLFVLLLFTIIVRTNRETVAGLKTAAN